MVPNREAASGKSRELLKRSKKGLLHLVFSRMGIIVLLLVLQVVALGLLFVKFEDYFPHYYIVVGVVSVGMVLFLLNTDSDPNAKITWLIIIMLVPAAGTLLYLYIHLDIGHRALRDRTHQIARASLKAIPPSPACEAFKKEYPADAALAYYLHQAAGFPVYDRSAAEYYPLGDDFYPALLTDLERAKSFIFLEYFIIEGGEMWNSVEEILTRKAAEGVEVRVLYDGTCEFSRLPHSFPERLRKKGIQCRIFAPIRPFVSTHYNYRDHRKIAVIDGQTAFTGGVNLADEYINRIHPFGHWKDTAIRVEGEAARSFTLLFLQMWQVEDRGFQGEPYLTSPVRVPDNASGYIIPYGDCPLDRQPIGEWVYTHILNTAQSYVHIMTPYLILGHELENAMRFAAQRGVEVSIILPHIPDKILPFALAKSHYYGLVHSGVKIYEYLPGFLHAKSFVSDDVRASVGTINLDYRSLRHHFECAAYLCGSDCVHDVEADFQQTLQRCKRISLQEAEHPGFKWRLLGTLMKLFAPLM